MNFKKTAILLTIPLFTYGCGGSGGGSTVEPSDSLKSKLSNGSSSQAQSSEWDCDVDGLMVTNAFFSDGSGSSNGRSPGVSSTNNVSWSVLNQSSASFNFDGEQFTLSNISFLAGNDRFTGLDSRGPSVTCDRVAVDTDTDTKVGQFKDSNTSGLSYVSGAQSGITDENGKFTYEVGSTVTFSVGGVVLGTSAGQSVVTPMDLVPGSSSSSVKVQNITRFLMMLDDDGIPSNGISIPPSIQEAAQQWSPVNFESPDLSTELETIITEARSVDGNNSHLLPTAGVAQSHLESTLRCIYAGAFKGKFTGEDNGNFGALVDASTGYVQGVSYSIPLSQSISLGGTRAVSYDQNLTFVSGSTSSQATFNGQFDSPDDVSGSWQNPFFRGSFSGSRIGGDKNAVYRLTGNYTGSTDGGLFSFDVDGSKNITGVAYSIITDELFDLSGTLSGSSLTATASNGTSITGTLENDQITAGTWNNADDGSSGEFSGNGCELN